MNKFCTEIQSECLITANVSLLIKPAILDKPSYTTQKISSCFYKCLKESFVKWATVLYKKTHLKSIDLIADTAFADSVLKINEVIESNKLYESNATVKTTLFNFFRYKLLENIQQENRRLEKEKQSLFTFQNKTDELNDEKKEVLLLSLEKSLIKLNYEDRQIIQWRHLEQKTCKEIAAILGITVPSATNKIYRAMENLRTFLNA